MKNLSILGSTGSIGRNTLKIVEMFRDRFEVKALAAANNVELLARQIEAFHPEIAVVFDENRALELKNVLPAGTGVEILYGEDGYRTAATYASVEMVVTAMVGAAGLMPTLAAIEAGKNIALANKETLVMAGEIVVKKAAEKGISILPIDSEHSAVFQCIAGHRREDLDKILLTASGGPFLNKSANEFVSIKAEEALNHPTWQMGKKISIDSATLMNKGLEVIEAKYLFGVSHDMIKVVIHPQSIVHSMVAYRDGSVIAQLGIPDMKGAIAYAISYPERLPLKQPIPDFVNIGALTFQQPDLTKFPCLALAFKACETGGTMPAVLNASNEVAVTAFLDKHISFIDIPNLIKNTMEKHSSVKDPTLSNILEADKWAREIAGKKVGR
ncbi:MAG: 1-deoxy-D-xylulose-5-phosphate reductoisomerase [Proteobacteria bacterium]|nr:1-deoxy-D-xylulose-5-phosphate reductoisomerase [Desulfobacteraceae bacterium]MBU3980705.1 1-deoxy-D-xylulose-5-phosphate reductoisomerase [Pseudomonadota bacterium]MBU4012488.1 1-deoxy-D-xylulose-5-phosphate reductoisomerase [Pseudomonadota bacterium]MBU4068994.1 1-deoxy-D-xylulose-5-phosphate reductoisomerase [Pseudomonadota bacterium]MBU4101181.1 1-deoxy-D-xylulose-5-phosphate reductoisomerase [Pseudomonadota bacterium]